MLLVKPDWKFTKPVDGLALLKSIETAGRVCYKSEDKITDDSAPEFIRKIIKRGHEAVIEHESITAWIMCDRGVAHEIVRHRIASYCQESTRYCDYNKGEVAFVIPPWFGALEEGVFDVKQLEEFGDTPLQAWTQSMLNAEMYYKILREMGQSPQEARSVLPNSLKAEIVMTMNLREWRHFFKLRTSAGAHPQMREIASQMLAGFKLEVPVIFDDIESAE